MKVGWGGEERAGWWETSVSWHPTYPTLPNTTGPTGPTNIFCQFSKYWLTFNFPRLLCLWLFCLGLALTWLQYCKKIWLYATLPKLRLISRAWLAVRTQTLQLNLPYLTGLNTCLPIPYLPSSSLHTQWGVPIVLGLLAILICLPFILQNIRYWRILINILRFISNVNLECGSGKFCMFSVWSHKCVAFSISIWRAVNSVQCVVCVNRCRCKCFCRCRCRAYINHSVSRVQCAACQRWRFSSWNRISQI